MCDSHITVTIRIKGPKTVYSGQNTHKKRLLLAKSSVSFMSFFSYYLENNLDTKVDYLHSTDDGEPSEESHGASNS